MIHKNLLKLQVKRNIMRGINDRFGFIIDGYDITNYGNL